MATLKDYYNTNDNDSAVVGTDTYLMAQTFTTSLSYGLSSVKLKLWRDVSNAPGTLTIDIKATDGSGHPTGASLKSGTTDGDTLTTNTNGEWREITLSSVLILANNTKYAIIVTQSTSTAGAYGWRAHDISPTYSGGAYERAGNPTWYTNTGVDMMFETWSVSTPPVDLTFSRKLVAIGSDQVWYESPAGTMSVLSAATNDIDTTALLTAIEAYGKIFITNGSNLKIADFVNVKLSTADIVGGGDPPDHGTELAGGSSGATMIVDYINSLTSATLLYGKRTSTATFTSGETVTGTDDDGNSVSFVLDAAEASGPFWYDWTVYGGDTSYGALPTWATIVKLYRGRLYLAGDKYNPHQWYMSRQGNPWDFNYAATDAQSPVAGNNSDVGEIGDIQIAAFPYKDDLIVMGCTNSIWLLAGDPMEGGTLNPLDLTTGIFGPHAYCWDGEGNLYFWGTNGIYKMTVPGTPQCISQVRLPNIVADEAVDPSTHRITLAYDPKNAGILVCITTMSDGTNSNYFYDLRTGGFLPDSYPTPCAVYSAFFYNAEDDDYRKLLLGCGDGYLRYFDPSEKSDVGTSADVAIDSYVKFGPISLSQSPDKQGVISGLNLVSAGGAASGSQSDSDDVEFSVFTARSAAEVIEKLSANSGPNFAGTFSAPGIRMGKMRNQRAKGVYLGIRLYNNTADESWAFEKMHGTVTPSGRSK